MAYNRSQDQPRPDDDEDEIDQFVQLSFSSSSEASGGSSADEVLDDDEWCSPILPYSTSSNPGKLGKYKNYVGFNSPHIM